MDTLDGTEKASHRKSGGAVPLPNAAPDLPNPAQSGVEGQDRTSYLAPLQGVERVVHLLER